MNILRLQRGYSLLELVIYIGLFALLSIVLVQSLISMVHTYAAAARYRALQNNGELIMERITRDVRNGTTLTASACATPVGSITVAGTNNEPYTLAYTVIDGRMQLSSNGAGAEELSTSEVVITGFAVCAFTTPVGSGAKISLSLSAAGSTPATASFYSTVLTRGQ